MFKYGLSTLLLTLFVFSYIDQVSAQQKTFDFGLFLGRSYYLGEINPTRHYGEGIGSSNIGAALRFNLNERYSLRATVIRTTLEGSDNISDLSFNNNRNATFETSLTEFSGGIEFNFLPYKNGDRRHFFTPYLFVGIGVFRFDPKTFIDDTEVVTEEVDKQSAIALPFGPGFRLSLGNKVNLSFEWGFRKTTTDYLDGLPNRVDDIIELGKDYDNDWYIHSGFMFMYRITPVGKCPVYQFN